jgi:tetratricopeptide (TPR) repeat protein
MSEQIRQRTRIRWLLWFSFVSLILAVTIWYALQQLYFQSTNLETGIFDSNRGSVDLRKERSAQEWLAVAKEEAEDLISDFPKTAESLNANASMLFRTSDTAGAQAVWEAALRIDPKSFDALFGIAQLAFERGQYDTTIGICDELTLLFPTNPRVPFLLADAFLHASQPKKAILTLQQHLSSEQASVQSVELLGNAFLQDKQPDKAIPCFEQALRIVPRSRDSLYGLGQAYARKGDRTKASEYMKQFEEIAASSSANNSDAAKAFQDKDHALSIVGQVFADAAKIHRRFGNLEIAESKLIGALALQPKMLGWLEELQSILIERKRLLEAAEVGRRLVSLEASNVDYQLKLGQLYSEIGLSSQAIESFERAVELAPDDPRCQKAKEVLQSRRR